ncbi:MAG: alanine--tRNA ligase [Chlorobi bacterium]|nr:alanine--tRNA ligase [Chlorobiota bacterium]
MTTKQIRQAFLDFFHSKSHHIVASAPMVVKNDPTLMFTNAGMNQFKDIFLGNAEIKYKRIANSQKCLRVSGKHNDLEEVGHDTYHHTMFEMLGNWSFGDYFKKEAIEFAVEFLVNKLGIDKNRLYATVFEGDSSDKLEMDKESYNYWLKYLPKDQVLMGSKKDNFWEMGNTGPCGPCSEIHIDIRNENERKKIQGSELVNKDHPQVIEIWNLVFIQYNRKADNSLEVLPMKHVDTGMGLERLSMVLQHKQSNYDTDVFQPLLTEIGKLSGKNYGEKEQWDIAMRVIADHIRTIAFAIADGQLPSNVKAGYVIRRILRRAVRYAYTFLGQNEPFLYKLLPVLNASMGEQYPELKSNSELIAKVITVEEKAFLKTLDTGIRMLEQIITDTKKNGYKVVNGKIAFELYDTYGFPFDLTELILRENDLIVSKREFDVEMNVQKERSRSASKLDSGDWIIVAEDEIEEFVGYDYLEADILITRYRKIKEKNNEYYHLVFNYTPFYAESGGQVGDTGYIIANNDKIDIIDTQKENNVIIHLAKKLPKNIEAKYHALVNKEARVSTANNHSGTHLLHQALREILGTHVEQKGSLVHPDYLRFDFSHFQRIAEEEIIEIEHRVNKRIRENFVLEEKRAIPIDEAKNMGAMALFGEKYGDIVRVIKYGDSVELCGGTHVNATGEIGFFKIISEGSVAAGIRRIEAITGVKAEDYILEKLSKIHKIEQLFKGQGDVLNNVEVLLNKNIELAKLIEGMNREKLLAKKQELKSEIEHVNGINFLGKKLVVNSAGDLKDIAYQLKGEVENLVLVIGAEINQKANLAIMISDNLVKSKGLNASNIIREISKEIHGGGGGQPFFATAGGKNGAGIEKAIEKAKSIVTS